MLQTLIRIAHPNEYIVLAELYLRWGYRAGIDATDVVHVATQRDQPVGLVRRTCENGITMLRGMHIAPTHQRRGIGRKLLSAFVRDLPSLDCCCIPFARLTAFYGEGDFALIDEAAAPAFLEQRALQYRRERYDVLIMRRSFVPDRGRPG